LNGFAVLVAVWCHAKPRSREGDAGRLFWVCVRVVLPPHPRPLSPVPGARVGFQLPVFGFRCSVPSLGCSTSRLRVSHCGGECCGDVGVSLEGGFAPSPPWGAGGARARPLVEHEYEYEQEQEVEGEGESFFLGGIVAFRSAKGGGFRGGTFRGAKRDYRGGCGLNDGGVWLVPGYP
jgi:hypothetical protein